METKVDTYTGCLQNAQVVLYSVKGAGDTRPGGEQYEVEDTIGKTSKDMNANEVIWSFLVTGGCRGKASSRSSVNPKLPCGFPCDTRRMFRSSWSGLTGRRSDYLYFRLSA